MSSRINSIDLVLEYKINAATYFLYCPGPNFHYAYPPDRIICHCRLVRTDLLQLMRNSVNVKSSITRLKLLYTRKCAKIYFTDNHNLSHGVLGFWGFGLLGFIQDGRRWQCSRPNLYFPTEFMCVYPWPFPADFASRLSAVQFDSLAAWATSTSPTDPTSAWSM